MIKGKDAPVSDHNEGACSKDNIRLDTNKAFDIFSAIPIKSSADDPLKAKLSPQFKRSIFKFYKIKQKNGFGQDERLKNIIAPHCTLNPRRCYCVQDDGIRVCEIIKHQRER